MTSFCVLVNSETTAFMELPEAEELRIGDFTEDGGACGAGGGGEVGGAMVEGFVGEEGEGVGFFGGFGDAKLGRTENFDTTGLVKVSHLRRIVLRINMQRGCQQPEQEWVVSASTGNNELMNFSLG